MRFSEEPFVPSRGTFSIFYRSLASLAPAIMDGFGKERIERDGTERNSP